MKRFSKKRQSIYECLLNTKTHPTAEWVYNQLKSTYPKLSLATVYRNINELKAEGKVVSIGKVLDKERFDAVVSPHTHVICIKCGKVIDVDNLSIPKEVLEGKGIEGFTLEYSKLQLFGVCDNCKD